MEEGWSIQENGLHVSLANAKGYLGASPDGLVCYGGEVRGCIHIPHETSQLLMRVQCHSSTVTRMKMAKIAVKLHHNYFYQVQGQLAILNFDWCDFIIWTNIDLHVERVQADPQFWQLQCLPKLQYYCYNVHHAA